MDQPPPPGSLDRLDDESLIEGPIDMKVVEDVYTVGPSPSQRWRVYIDAENWEPKNYHGRLLQAKAYHSRSLYEICMLLSYTNSSWLSLDVLGLIKSTTHLELRRVEFELVSFQLTCGMIGIKVEKKNHDLYHCGTILFTTLMWISKNITKLTNTKPDKDKFYGMMELKPFPSESPKQLAKIVDKLIFAIFSFLQHESFQKASTKFPEATVRELGYKLQSCVLAMDGLISLVED